METMQPTLRNGRNIWDRVNMPFKEFQGRVDSLRKKMADRQMDALLAYGHAFNHYGNPCYISNYMIRLPRGFMVALTRNDAALFFEGASRGLPSAKRLTWVEDVRPCPDISRECVQYLEEKALLGSKIGLAGLREWMPQDQFSFLSDALKGGALVDAQPLLQEMRMIKSGKELDQIRRASRIVKKSFDKLDGLMLPTVSEGALDASIIREARLEGAEDVRILFGKPQEDAWALHPAGDNSLKSGEALIVYIALVYERYWSEAIRTLKVEGGSLLVPESGKGEAFYGELVECLEPGKALSLCARDIKAKMVAQDADWFSGYGLGQGIGLSPEESPRLAEDAEGALESGMCLTLRACVRDKDLGAVMVGNTLAVTEKGMEVLTA